MKKQRVQFIVTLDMPPDATKRDARAYVQDAVQSMRGGMMPDEPMHALNYKTVTVRGVPDDCVAVAVPKGSRLREAKG